MSSILFISNDGWVLESTGKKTVKGELAELTSLLTKQKNAPYIVLELPYLSREVEVAETSLKARASVEEAKAEELFPSMSRELVYAAEWSGSGNKQKLHLHFVKRKDIDKLLTHLGSAAVKKVSLKADKNIIPLKLDLQHSPGAKTSADKLYYAAALLMIASAILAFVSGYQAKNRTSINQEVTGQTAALLAKQFPNFINNEKTSSEIQRNSLLKYRQFNEAGFLYQVGALKTAGISLNKIEKSIELCRLEGTAADADTVFTYHKELEGIYGGKVRLKSTEKKSGQKEVGFVVEITK